MISKNRFEDFAARDDAVRAYVGDAFYDQANRRAIRQYEYLLNKMNGSTSISDKRRKINRALANRINRLQYARRMGLLETAVTNRSRKALDSIQNRLDKLSNRMKGSRFDKYSGIPHELGRKIWRKGSNIQEKLNKGIYKLAKVDVTGNFDRNTGRMYKLSKYIKDDPKRALRRGAWYARNLSRKGLSAGKSLLGNAGHKSHDMIMRGLSRGKSVLGKTKSKAFNALKSAKLSGKFKKSKSSGHEPYWMGKFGSKKDVV